MMENSSSPKTDYVNHERLQDDDSLPMLQDAQPLPHKHQVRENATEPTKFNLISHLTPFRWYAVWFALRWKLATNVFAKPLPCLTANLDVKLGDLLVTLPLAGGLLAWCAVDFSRLHTASAGQPAAIAMMIVFLLTVRNNSLLLAVTGLPFERMIFYHKLFGVVTMILSSLHGLSYLLKHHQVYGTSDATRTFSEEEYKDASSRAALSGVMAFSPLAALFLLSFGPVRRRFFEFFVRTHWMLFILIIVGALAHKITLVLIGAAFWGIDMLYRMIYQTRVYSKGTFLTPTKTCSEGSGPASTDGGAPKRLGVVARDQLAISKLSNDLICIQFPKIRGDTGECFHYEAGQYTFLCIPTISLLEWHPFTISSTPHEPLVTFHIKAMGDWTRKLLKLIPTATCGTDAIASPFEILVDGPYGNVSIDVATPTTYSHVVLFSGGIGITPMKSIVNQLYYEYHHKNRHDLKKVHFVWSMRDRAMIQALLVNPVRKEGGDRDDDSHQHGHAAQSYLPDAWLGLASSSSAAAAAPVFTTELFLTRNERDLESRVDQELEHCIRYNARPDIAAILRNIGEGALSCKRDRVAVLVCGPSTMIKQVVTESIKLTRDMKVAFDVHNEHFEF